MIILIFRNLTPYNTSTIAITFKYCILHLIRVFKNCVITMKCLSLTRCFHHSFSVLFSDGVNVDWPGWCFDDDEVMDYMHPTEEGLLEGISRSLAFWDVHRLLEQEDGECSQV